MITVAILTVSDSTVAGTRVDVSGPALKDRCEELGWKVVATAIRPDEAAKISELLTEWADNFTASVILTTGGTGLSTRDVTPEATRAILEREIPGLAELMRSKGLEQTQFAPLSRALAGTRRKTLIVNLPGAPKGSLFSLGVVEPLVPHIVQLLKGHTQHEA